MSLGGRRSAVVVAAVDGVAVVVALVVGVVGRGVAPPVVRVGAHGREAHAAGHGRAVVVAAVRVRAHAAVTAVPAGRRMIY